MGVGEAVLLLVGRRTFTDPDEALARSVQYEYVL